MSIRRSILALAALLASASASAELLAVSDEELSAVSGQQGVAVELDMKINLDPATNGPLASIPIGQRRFALSYNNRPDKWLVIKNYYARIFIPKLNLDGTRTDASGTPYRDLDSFKDSNGNPLLANPDNIASLSIQYPEPLYLLFNVGGISFETGAAGYNNPSEASFLGWRLGNANSQLGQITPLGKMRIIGF